MSKDLKHELEDEIICPFCDAKINDCWNGEDFDDDGAVECDECGKDFWVTVHKTIRYTTSRVPCAEKDIKHEFEIVGTIKTISLTYDRLVCKNCGEEEIKRKKEI